VVQSLCEGARETQVGKGRKDRRGASRGAQQGAVEEGKHRQINKGWEKYIQQLGQRGFCLHLNLILSET
jgi:hypothetical protein